MFANLYNQQLAACNALHELNLYLLPKDIEDRTWDSRKSCFYDVSNRTMDIVATYFAQYEGQPMAPVPDCLLYLEDMQDDRRIALFLLPDVLMCALELSPWYDFDEGQAEQDRFINDLRARLLDIRALECIDDEEDYYEQCA